MRLDAGGDPARDRQSKWMAITFAYMLALAYLGSLVTYNIAHALGLG